MMIPYWLQNNIRETCKCGGVIYNNDELTKRRCTNECCPYHMGKKVENLLSYLNIKGVGKETALDIVRNNKLTSHLQAIPYFFKEKPSVYLREVAQLTYIEGHDTDMRQYCEGHESFATVFLDTTALPFWFSIYENTFKYAETFFDVKKPLSKQHVNLMITGSLYGFTSRPAFVDYLNARYGHIIQFTDIKKRQSNVHYLVCEDDAVEHDKMRLARQCGIKRITPANLIKNIEEAINTVAASEREE